MLSKIDEKVLKISGEKYNLYTNMGKDYISDGYQYEQSFEKITFLFFTYKVEDIYH